MYIEVGLCEYTIRQIISLKYLVARSELKRKQSPAPLCLDPADSVPIGDHRECQLAMIETSCMIGLSCGGLLHYCCLCDDITHHRPSHLSLVVHPLSPPPYQVSSAKSPSGRSSLPNSPTGAKIVDEGENGLIRGREGTWHHKS